jgi:hypothetical protein
MKSFLQPLAIVFFVIASTAVAKADVVFGNLGASGTAAIGSTNTDYGPGDSAELSLAQGFSVGSSSTNLDVQSVKVGLFATSSGSVPLTVAIYSDNSGVPGSALFTSGTVNVGNTGVYTFPFSGVSLNTSTSYWIVPQGPASWYLNDDDTSPAGQNSSGYARTSTKRNSPSVGWTTPSPNLSSYSVSINAVPEPSTLALAGLGMAACVVAARRRRRS